MAQSQSRQNSIAIFLVVISKAFGIAGLIVAMFNRVAGGTLLAMDGALILSAVLVSLRAGRQQAKAADNDRDIVARLVREGTLKQYLRDVEESESDRTKNEEAST